MLHLIGQGRSNQDIATALFLTVNTIKSYIRTAYRKIGVTTRTQAVQWGLLHGVGVDEERSYRDVRPAGPC